ncbi:MAG: pyruvate dehydrogenase (acetyl-transferring) E1 component subunit alpha [candidate division NC10 bacterium RIFCSPLOWO2_12_FULL_66_18]|nr:MAG: pyruvate dehydrogenase (acetyl-transferring) E1 component subunit alpha [candidate division NC10 bacterium RIFCSPLOWO2_02_FULL_66_22]OGB98439.1 MAG: pyruvate dehydrogenase (acetyl-transferring) E1 component subunit alpha [candidate division NC10 bacterium RIFCSPLOWO2_12_FULL_66_18]
MKPLDKAVLLEIYRKMVAVRVFEETAADLFLKGQLPGFLHSYIGEEAVAAGVCAHLTPQDMITSTHRGHGHAVAKGARLDMMMAELFAKKTGYCHGKGGSMHIADLELGILGANGIVGAGVPIATGAGLAQKMRGSDRVTVAFFGDGGSNTGAFHEGVNMAAVWNLPVVFVCENNQYAESTPRGVHQKVKDIAQRAAAYDIPGVVADGMDVFDVYQKAGEAIHRARTGGGPTLVEAKTYRFLGHYVGDPQTYRTKEEVEQWRQRDPIVLFRKRAMEEGTVAAAELDAIDAAIAREMEAAVQFARESPEPEEEAALQDIFTE